jgi:hypothetical protein
MKLVSLHLETEALFSNVAANTTRGIAAVLLVMTVLKLGLEASG